MGAARPTPRYQWSDPASAGSASSAGSAYSSVKFRVTVVSTGMPGPVVVETTIFFR